MHYHPSRYIGFSLPLFVCTLLPGQPALCTQDTIVGTYAIVTQGTVLMPSSAGSQPVAAPAATFAILSIDSHGVASGPAMGTHGNSIALIPGGATIQVNPDCTAVGKTAVGTTSFDVIVDEGREIHTFMFEGPGVTPIVRGIARRISRIPATVAPEQCSQADVHGIYAVTYEGTLMMAQPGAAELSPVPGLSLGLHSIDYQGQLSGHGKITAGGNSADYSVASGEIAVKPDCSAVATWTTQIGPLAQVGETWMAVLEGGGELWGIQTSLSTGKPVVTSTWKRISPIPTSGQQ